MTKYGRVMLHKEKSHSSQEKSPIHMDQTFPDIDIKTFIRGEAKMYYINH